MPMEHAPCFPKFPIPKSQVAPGALESRAPASRTEAWARDGNHKVMTRGAVYNVISFSLRQWYCNDLSDAGEHIVK